MGIGDTTSVHQKQVFVAARREEQHPQPSSGLHAEHVCSFGVPIIECADDGNRLRLLVVKFDADGLRLRASGGGGPTGAGWSGLRCAMGWFSTHHLFPLHCGFSVGRKGQARQLSIWPQRSMDLP
jgi:hypothetical protein